MSQNLSNFAIINTNQSYFVGINDQKYLRSPLAIAPFTSCATSYTNPL